MSKYTWISIADLHLKLNESLGKIQEDMNTRTRDKLAVFELVCKKAVEKKVNMVFLLGDMFDRLNPPQKLRDYFIKAIMPLIQANIPIYWIIGNHETDMHSSNFTDVKNLFEQYPAFPLHILTGIESFNLDGWHFVMVPAVYYDKEIIEILEKLEQPKTLLFGHWETKEALIGEEEFRYHEGIPSKHYEKFKRVYLGDFHKYQKYTNWMYAGSLCKRTFSERSDAKGFIYTEFDTESGDIKDTFVPTPDRKFIQLNSDDVIPDIKNAVVKVILKSKEACVDKDNIIKNFYTLGAHKVIYEFVNTVQLSIQDAKVSASSSFEDDIATFCTEKKRIDLIDLGKQVLEEAKTGEI